MRRRLVQNKALLAIIIGLVGLMMLRPLQHFRFSRDIVPSPKNFTQNISINTGSTILKLQVEVADTDEKRMTGLMNRPFLDPNAGMLFIFNEEGDHFFWMKNTLISLDLLFIDSQKKVIFIAQKTTPLSETTIAPPAPVQYVLEVNAGYASKNGVTVGSQITF